MSRADEIAHLLMQFQLSQQQENRFSVWGYIAGYDPVRHYVNCIVPKDRDESTGEPIVTPWMPLGSQWVGKGFGIQIAPLGGATIDNPTGGEPVLIELIERDIGVTLAATLCFNSILTPPLSGIQPGEALFQDRRGTFIYYKTDGSLNISSHQDANITVGRDLNVTVTRDTVVHAGRDLTATVARNLSATVSGNATAHVVGTAGLTIDGDTTATLGGNLAATVAGTASLSVTGATTATLHGGLTATITGNLAAVVSGAASIYAASISLAASALATVQGLCTAAFEAWVRTHTHPIVNVQTGGSTITSGQPSTTPPTNSVTTVVQAE